jgi:predicted nuclease of predicted toxin-antitoxin system
MRFLVDECTGPAVARWLKGRGFVVFSVYDQARGLDDEAVLQKAFSEGWVLVTNDGDFGTKVFRERRPHRGVVSPMSEMPTRSKPFGVSWTTIATG